MNDFVILVQTYLLLRFGSGDSFNPANAPQVMKIMYHALRVDIDKIPTKADATLEWFAINFVNYYYDTTNPPKWVVWKTV